MQVEEPISQVNMKTKKKKTKWTYEEDRILKEAVRICGPSKWDKIALKIEGRTGKQCRERWLAFLDPNINNTPFTKEEDDLIYSLQQKFGNHWKKISAYLNGRTDISVKNHWRSLRKKFGIESSKTPKTTEASKISLEDIENSYESDSQNNPFISLEDSYGDLLFNEFL